LLEWTEGRALVGTGSPFEDVSIAGRSIHIAQINNAYIFPGLALGIVASNAARVTDAMVKAATQELLRHLPTQKNANACLLPPLSQVRSLSRLIGHAVGMQAIREGQAQVADEENLNLQLDANIWEPLYLPYER
jgi:malate dehydrogenase (oxaloacetate-decarboxylating)